MAAPAMLDNSTKFDIASWTNWTADGGRIIPEATGAGIPDSMETITSAAVAGIRQLAEDRAETITEENLMTKLKVLSRECAKSWRAFYLCHKQMGAGMYSYGCCSKSHAYYGQHKKTTRIYMETTVPITNNTYNPTSHSSQVAASINTMPDIS
ncbi:hypothetical protein EYC84_000395 [Monilinia fructicola]|uniref:Uncharacterized protein n=1 Tax=Monilinia fructicola TaxID=38448 RepID=A0A5M9JQR2_MONFR|nr:hypothetical protein EYC84_000395 [Monilinia fructicola]